MKEKTLRVKNACAHVILIHVTSCRSTFIVPLHLGFVMVGRVLYIAEKRDVMGSVRLCNQIWRAYSCRDRTLSVLINLVEKTMHSVILLH